MKKEIELTEILHNTKRYSFYNDLCTIANSELLIFFKNKKLYIFNEKFLPKLKSIENISIEKLFKNKKLNVEDFENINKIVLDLLQEAKQAQELTMDMCNQFNSSYKSPKTDLKLDISNYCTLNCKYCFQKEKNTQKLPIEDCYRQIDRFFEENPKLAAVNVTMCMTSEPFLDLDYINKVYNYIQEKCLNKLKFETSQKELFEFLGITTQEEYNQILEQRDYFKSAFSNMDKRFISDELQSELNYIQYCSNKEEIKVINKEVIYTALSASKNMYYLWFTTNGTILPNEKNLSFIKKLFSSSSLGVSIDGNYFNSKSRVYKDGKSSYKDVINNIKFFQKEGIKLEANCTITKKNNNFIHLIKFFEKQGFNKIHFSFEKGVFSKKIIKNLRKAFEAYNNGKLSSLYGLDVYLSFIKGNRFAYTQCAAYTHQCIGYDNKQYFCDYFVTKKNCKCFNMNDISVYKRKPCIGCPFKMICGGACVALSNGDINKVPLDACNFRKNHIKQTIFSFCDKD